MWLISFCLIAQAYGIKLTYPFAGVDYRDRADDILDKLRSNLNLNVFQDTISQTLSNPEGPRKMYIKNSEGNLFVVDKPSHPIKSASNETGMELYDPVALASALEGTCAMLSIDYWNYEWCHRKEVSQFHMEQQGPTFTKSPDWSLGKFERSVYVRENQRNASTPIIKVVDYFKGGQHCDEIDTGRSIEIHMQCCEKTHLKNFIAADLYYAEKPSTAATAATTGPPMPKATLNAIDEPSVCAYKAIVCTPLLCKKPDYVNKELTSATGPEGRVFTEIMKALNSTCLLRSEVWWTYELCFGKGVRQLRLNTEQSVMPDGNVQQKQVMAIQFILGNPQLNVMTNETALMQRTNPNFFKSSDSVKQPQREEISSKELEIIASSGLVSPLFKARGKEPKFLTLEYDNGTLCDLHNMNRSTIVEVYCGLSNNIVSIMEDSTCHYRMKVEVTALCALTDFQPKKDNISTIAVNPVYPQGDSEFGLDDLVAAAAESTVNYQVPETHTRVMQDGTVIETQTAVFPNRHTAVENDATAVDPTAIAIKEAAAAAAEAVAAAAVSVDASGGMTPEEFAESKATKPPSDLPSDLPYSEPTATADVASGVDEPVVVAEVHPDATVEVATPSSESSTTTSTESTQPPVDVRAPLTETVQPHSPQVHDHSKVEEIYKAVLLGLSVLMEANEYDAPITRDEYAAAVANVPTPKLLAQFAQSRAAITPRWLRRIMDIIDYETLTITIDSVPNRPRGSDTFYLDRMTCYGPKISTMFITYRDKLLLSSDEEEHDARVFESWIDCLKHEENLLIAIEAMFTFNEVYERTLERAKLEDNGNSL